MKRDSKRELKPKLRFPGFSEPWEYKVLAPYLEDCSSRVSSVTNLPVYTSARSGLQRQEDYYRGRVLINENEYGVVPVGCFVYRHMSDDGRFIFHINDTGGAIAVSKEYPVFKAVNLAPQFLLAKLNHGADFRAFAMSQKAGGTRTRLYFSKLRNWTALLPSFSEQQKIADCLSSLDEVIAAQALKLDVLKAHKKGLMQQLFPREGEIVPRLRFPEFQHAKAWHKQKISALLSKMSKPVPVEAIQMYREIGIRSHGRGIFHKDFISGKAIGNKRVFWVVKDAFIVNIVFAWEQAVATTSKAEEGMIASHRFPMYVAKAARCDVRYLKHFFLTRHGKHLLGLASPGGAGRNRTLGREEFEKLEILLPQNVEEQNRIADFLFSIDALIDAQTQKLEALKIHKKGLIQQLFPSPGEVEA